MTDFSKVSNEQLMAELAKRLGSKAPARRGGFKKSKREWAQGELDEARRALEIVEQEVVSAGPQTARKMSRVDFLRDKIRKFEGLVKRYTESGE